MEAEEILELLSMAPASRLAWRQPSRWTRSTFRALQILAGRHVPFVVVGAAAERLHGVPIDVPDVEIRSPAGHRDRLFRALRQTNRRFLRVGLTVICCSRESFQELALGSTRMELPGDARIAVQGLSDLIAAAPPERQSLLRYAREATEARGA